MPFKTNRISLIYFVVATLLLVGLVPSIVTGWLLSGRSGREMQAAEGRYQTQLVQDKARQIEMFGQHYGDLAESYAKSLELSQDLSLLSSPQTQQKLSESLKENPNLLALFIKPTKGEPLSVYRPEKINQKQLDFLSSETLSSLGEKKITFGQPIKLDTNAEPILTIGVPVYDNKNISAAVVAVVSLGEISRIMSETRPANEKELWEKGLPIVFVVDEKGHAVFHPDAQTVSNQKELTGLKIVEEWRQSNRQIRSALIPFSAEYDGKNHEMIGAYSTANLSDINLGVIAMQDENHALASVGEMRRQIWMIILVIAVIALIVGSLFARQLTNPLLKLVSAAQKIASGNLSTKVGNNKIKELDTLGSAFNTMSESLSEHIANLDKAAKENRELFVGTVKALAAAIDGKDKYTRGHSERVSRISVAIGQRLKLSEEEVETLRISALLHDVGKIGVSDQILNKPSALTDEEFEMMKSHPKVGYKIMAQIPAMKNYLPGIYMHHEMINGAGYPQGLKDAEIPLQARIISVADTFDAMTIDRPYQKGFSIEDTLNRIKSFVGTRYDGKVVEALVQACNDGQIGVGTVKLKSAESVRKETSNIAA